MAENKGEKLESSVKGNKRNILFITIDALRSSHIGENKDINLKTPVLDDLWKNGLSFNNFYSAGCPTQMALPSIFTSTYPLDHGGYNLGISSREASFVEILKKENYYTSGAFTAFWGASWGGYKRGFDRFEDYFSPSLICANLSGAIIRQSIFDFVQKQNDFARCIWILYPWLEKFFSWIDEYCWLKKEEISNSAAVLSPVVFNWDFDGLQNYFRELKQKFVQDPQNFLLAVLKNDFINKDVQKFKTKRLPQFVAGRVASADNMVDVAKSILAERPSEKPFFYWLHLMDVHDKLFTYHDAQEQSCLDSSQVSASEQSSEMGQYWREKKYNIHYNLALSYVDKAIGRLLGWLKEKKQLENTFIVITSDHGLANVAPPYRKNPHPTNFFDELYHVPFCISGPGIAGEVRQTFHSHLALAPTLLDILEIGKNPSFRGKSLFVPNSEEDFFLFENQNRGMVDFGTKDTMITVRTKTSKMMSKCAWENENITIKNAKYYDLVTDKHEMFALGGIEQREMDKMASIIHERMSQIPKH